MEPHLAKRDTLLFYKYLDKSSYFFEYGTGGSTYHAIIRKNIKSIVTVETDYIWHRQFKFLLEEEDNRSNFVYCEMDTQPNTWGNPGPNSTQEQIIDYSDQIRKLGSEKTDFVLIDGRFRVACCLKCFDVVTDKCLIAFDDFLNRPDYHIVLDYYDIIDKSDDNIMVILKKKKNIKSPSLELIEKYEKIKN
jgi:hypothetical protein